MIEIKSNEAKIKFSEILRHVEDGEHYLITRHGKGIAQILPLSTQKGRSLREAITAMKAFRKIKKPKGMSLKAMIRKGRR